MIPSFIFKKQTQHFRFTVNGSSSVPPYLVAHHAVPCKSDYVLTFDMCEEFIYVTVASLADNGVQAPLFLQEPISEVMFSNENGSSQLSCSANGTPSPTLAWVQKDGSPVTSVLGLRYTYAHTHIYKFKILRIKTCSFRFVVVWFGFGSVVFVFAQIAPF